MYKKLLKRDNLIFDNTGKLQWRLMSKRDNKIMSESIADTANDELDKHKLKRLLNDLDENKHVKMIMDKLNSETEANETEDEEENKEIKRGKTKTGKRSSSDDKNKKAKKDKEKEKKDKDKEKEKKEKEKRER